MRIMEARILQQHPTWIDPDSFSRKPTAAGSGSARFSRRMRQQQRLQVVIQLQPPGKGSNRGKPVSAEVSSSYKNLRAAIVESGSAYAPSDESVMLKNKSQEIESYLNGRCIYLVGMMGSGKTTVGKVLSGLLGYSFCDSDTFVEQDTDGTSVAEIFKLYGEGYFRNKETEALQKLSLMHRLVVSTGGGAVIRPINWKYMKKGVTVWLDVPLEALAQRIAAVGTNSRPLLHHESGDEYTKALRHLSTLWEQRGEAYEHAHARVSLENIAAKLGHMDIFSITPATIALEALEEIEGYLNKDGSMAVAEF